MSAKPAWPQGYALKELESVDSTNEEARRMAAAGAPGRVWIFARHQSAGRGRRRRAWETGVGNLATSLLLRPEKSPAEAAQLSFVAALAAFDTMQGFAPSHRIEVKWPNDVLADGRKIAGILLESASTQSRRVDWLVIGIGINLAYHPEGVEFPATSLAALGVVVPDVKDVLLHLAAAWVKWYETWEAQGFAEIRDSWLARAAGLGTRIRARLQHEETSGVFEGIDENGALLLRESQSRLRTVAAGEVFF